MKLCKLSKWCTEVRMLPMDATSLSNLCHDLIHAVVANTLLWMCVFPC